jgi:hypothetical protein
MTPADLESRALAVIAESCLRPGSIGYAYAEFCGEFGVVLPTRWAEIHRESNSQVWQDALADLRRKHGEAAS